MNIPVSIQAISEAVQKYHDLLKSMPEDDFCRKPADGGWSCSEVYCHVIQVNMRSLVAVERCIYGKQPKKSYGVPLFSRIILYFGAFPPGRLKSPPNVAAIVKVISREEAKNDLIKFISKLNELVPKALRCSGYQRVRHQRLGMLNCAEWIRFMEIHTRHHLKQIGRIRGLKIS